MPKEKDIERKWHLLNADNYVLGRLATEVANLLMGKHKSYYVPHLDCGDFVIVTNAEKIRLTGNKLNEKIDYRHSGYPGGDRYTPYSKLLSENPQRAIMLAVKGMLPKNKLGRQQIKRLKVYKGPEHPHMAQINSSNKKNDIKE